MDVRGPRDIRVVNGDAACRVAFLAPAALELSLTDQFDPPPHPRIDLVEWHLTAQNPLPTEQMEFVTVIQPHRAGEEPPGEATLQELEGGYRVEAPLPSGRVVAQIRPARSVGTPNEGARPETEILVTRYDRAGRSIDGLSIKGERAVVLKDMSTFRLIPPPWESRLAAHR